MKHAIDMENPRTDQWAHDLALRTPREMIPELAEAGPWFPWERADPRVREVFRDRVRALLAGDITIIPPDVAIHARGPSR